MSYMEEFRGILRLLVKYLKYNYHSLYETTLGNIQ